MRKALAGLALAVTLILGGAHLANATGSPPPDNTNEVTYWCPNGGVKYDPVSTPFVVPPPPAGKVWTLLVLKAGSDVSVPTGANETFPNPVVGQSYSHSSGKDLSHAILCYGPIVTTVPTTAPTTIATTLPTTIVTTIPTTIATTLPTTIVTTIPTTIATTLPTTVVTTIPTTVATTIPTTPPTTTATTVPVTNPNTVPTTIPTTPPTTVPVTNPCPGSGCPQTTPVTTAPTTVATTAPTTVATTVPPRAVVVEEPTPEVVTAPPAAPTELPKTGVNPWGLVMIGLGLLTGGKSVEVLARRRP